MVSFYGIILAKIVVLFLVPGLDSQCYDCAKAWKTKCNTSQTGYYCMPGAEISRVDLTSEQFATSTPDPTKLFSACSPYPLHVDYIQQWCCFWSDSIGCQVAMHPQIYKSGHPSRFCDFCKTKCICRGLSVLGVQQPWHWTYLGCITLLMHRFF
ncbi:uncharacterized protein Dvir_GJ25585 [Drosophila virilis]|uniref:Uncharacterized protein n=1 Tax=Drosophila virilis TaxID=7244 RepID=A0A0Q9WAZ3_DROVI|nr:uncharacterized protein LOC26530355 [Drosophila virilis]KRF79399.1 uncharacterized protein Dvir_GJ25585 [Drosophila virilis]